MRTVKKFEIVDPPIVNVTALRNVRICAMWEALEIAQELTYSDKIKYLSDKFFLSMKAIEAILRKNRLLSKSPKV